MFRVLLALLLTFGPTVNLFASCPSYSCNWSTTGGYSGDVTFTQTSDCKTTRYYSITRSPCAAGVGIWVQLHDNTTGGDVINTSFPVGNHCSETIVLQTNHSYTMHVDVNWGQNNCPPGTVYVNFVIC